MNQSNWILDKLKWIVVGIYWLIQGIVIGGGAAFLVVIAMALPIYLIVGDPCQEAEERCDRAWGELWKIESPTQIDIIAYERECKEHNEHDK